MPLLAGQKRKVNYDHPGTPIQARKRHKGKDARAISSQTADAALSVSGELNIASYVKSREFEIAALDQSMKKSRKNLTQRAFQQVPRHMRRRTASHNVKKVPKRVRSRASREMKEDNTPTGRARKKKFTAKVRLRIDTANQIRKLNVSRKSARQKKREEKLNIHEPDPAKHVSITRVPRVKKNKLAAVPMATSKYKRRQVNKTWLPTHLWHTKRAHMTRPTLPLWRMAIPLKPTEKSYRPTHRAAGARGCVASDTSYFSTIGCQGTEATLETLLKALGFSGEGWLGAKYRRWKSGSRYAEGWAQERDNGQKLIAPILVVWQAQTAFAEAAIPQGDMDIQEKRLNKKKTRLDRKIFIRVHPAAFYLFWKELIKVAKMQKPQVLIEDLRFEIGSISITGPESTEVLAGVLKLAQGQTGVWGVWPDICALSNPASLPPGAMLAFDIEDPRYSSPSKQQTVIQSDHELHEMNQLIVSWPLDHGFPVSRIFDHRERYQVSKALPSQKAINRRRAATLPGQILQPSEQNCTIPVILLAHRSLNKDLSSQGSWTVLLPWSCVDLVWRCLMYYPLSTGNTPRFGGLEQMRQIAFEHIVPWFPGDYAGLESGKAWARTEDEQRFDQWLRRPPSKRFSFDAIDLGLGRKGEHGRGWACDWEYLFTDTTNAFSVKRAMHGHNGMPSRQRSAQLMLLTQRRRKEASNKAEEDVEERTCRRNTSSPEAEEVPADIHNDIKYDQLDRVRVEKVFGRFKSATVSREPLLATVRIRFLTRGTPKSAARIYRLPLKRGQERIESTMHGETELQPPSGDRQTKTVAACAQARPLLFDSSVVRSSRDTSQMELRQRWLDLDPKWSVQNSYSPTMLPSLDRKERRNRYGDCVSRLAYDSGYTRDLSHVRVFPPHETKTEILNMLGPEPSPRTARDWEKVLKPQPTLEEGLWEKHVPCPDAEDLIGFVTTGGYNLAEGRGVAIGNVWVQRVLEGWQAEEHKGAVSQTIADSAAASPSDLTNKPTKEKLPTAEEVKQREKQADRERHLCIVRNAGESVGRLAVWELS